MAADKTILIVGTYDTKSDELAYMRACVEEELEIAPGDTHLIPTGIAMHIEESGLAAMLLPSADDSAHEERYLDFLSLRIETVERTVGRGDTLAGLLADAGVERLEAHNALQSLGDVFNPRRLRAGQTVSLTFENRGERRDFAGLELSPDIETRIVVARGEDGEFAAQSIANQFETRLSAAAGTIESSLYAASNGAGVPDPVLIAVIRAYSFEVDFQRDRNQPGR